MPGKGWLCPFAYVLVLLIPFCLFVEASFAQEPQETPEEAGQEAQSPDTKATVGELAKAVQNPVARLISVPIQNNNNFNIGPYSRTQDVLNIQPVIPVTLSENWNLIARIIQPIIWQPYSDAPSGGDYGLGDMNPTFFLSPAKPGKIIWGAGPALVLPTATSTSLGQGKFSLGPSLVLLTQPGHWSFAVLTSNVWSVAGSGSRPAVNEFSFQYFITYNFKKGYYLTSQPTISANWEASSPNRWTVPWGGGGGRVMKLGAQPVNLRLLFYGNSTRPPGAASWSMLAQISFLFPRAPKVQQ